MNKHPLSQLRAIKLARKAGTNPSPQKVQQAIDQQPTNAQSITVLKELTPIRLATQRPLVDGEQWSGYALTHYDVATSLFGGAHYRIKLYCPRLLSEPVEPGGMGRIPVFVIRWSCTNEQLKDDAFRAQVEATARGYMDMLNSRRLK